MRKLLLYLTILVATGFSAYAQKRAMTTDDYINMVDLRAALISPDGSFVIYGKSELNWKENKYDTKYYHIPSDSGASYRYIGEDGGSDLKFSPDGKYLSLKRKVDDNTQLFLLPTAGGEAIQLTKHESSIGNYEWAKDSKNIYFESDLPKTKEEKKKEKEGYDQLFVDEAPNGQREGQWEHLWKFDIDTKKEIKLTRGDLIIGDFAVSPDQKRIVYTARFQNRRNLGYQSEIYLLHAGDSVATKLTDNEAPEGNLTWFPDNRYFIFSAPDDEKYELRQDKLWMMNANSGDYEPISDDFKGTMRDYYLHPAGDKIFFSGTVKTNTNLFALDVDSKDVEQLSEVTGTFNAMGFDKQFDRVLFAREDVRTPPDLYVAELDNLENPVRLTDLNPLVKDSLELADYEVVSWKSYDGLEIEGITYTPADIHGAEEKAPFLLHIHGGPAGVFTNSFSARYHIWAGLGYVQLAPNVRGSTAYGDQFLQGNMQDIGDGDYEDLMSGVDMMIEQGNINEEKMAVRGWSYGGILGGTVITKTGRFRAASLGAMVSDWSSEYALGFNFDVRLWYIGGTPWSNPKGYRTRSPASNAANVTTPTLFLHGANDRVDTPEQSRIFFTYLKDIGKVDTRLIIFKREGHGFREPRNRRKRDIEEIKWIQKYTLGKEWQPWKRTDSNDERNEGQHNQ